MKLKIYSLIFFMTAFLTGILAPVLSLILLDKGASLSNLSIVLGIYAFTVIVSELPSGVAADVFGRKKSFCISIILSILSIITILLSKRFVFLCAAMVLYGLGRAMSSGSFEAMFIDYYIDLHGKDKLHNITTRLSVLEALGMATGALSGGFLPDISGKYFSSMGMYDMNLITRISVGIIVAVLSFAFIQEDKVIEKEKRISLREHIKNSSAIVTKNSTIICIFISVFATGFFLSSLETYWQPHFITLLPEGSSKGLLGLMAFLYFAAATIGSIASNKVIKRFKPNILKMYLIFRTLLAVSLILVALQTNVPIFISLYATIYLMFGMSMVPEGAILNKEIPNEVRASVLSVNSLAMQVGGLTGSLLYSILIKYISIPSIWIIAASLVIVTVVIIAKKLLGKKPSETITAQ